jgi:hypothetical protein
LKPALGRVCETLSQKYPTQKRAGGIAQVIEYLISKCKALSSNSSAAKRNENEFCVRNWAQRLVPVILASQEVEIRGSQFDANLARSHLNPL